MALYGREQWIKKYYDGQIFFDRKLLEDKKIDLAEFQQKAAEFLVQSAGVQDVITSHQMLHGAYNANVQFYRNGYYKGISGDLFLELQPGWRVDRAAVSRYTPGTAQCRCLPGNLLWKRHQTRKD